MPIYAKCYACLCTQCGYSWEQLGQPGGCANPKCAGRQVTYREIPCPKSVEQTARGDGDKDAPWYSCLCTQCNHSWEQQGTPDRCLNLRCAGSQVIYREIQKPGLASSTSQP